MHRCPCHCVIFAKFHQLFIPLAEPYNKGLFIQVKNIPILYSIISKLTIKPFWISDFQVGGFVIHKFDKLFPIKTSTLILNSHQSFININNRNDTFSCEKNCRKRKCGLLPELSPHYNIKVKLCYIRSSNSFTGRIYLCLYLLYRDNVFIYLFISTNYKPFCFVENGSKSVGLLWSTQLYYVCKDAGFHNCQTI